MSLAACLLALLVLTGGAPAVGAPQGQPEVLARGPIAAAFLQAPLTFEVNRGQTAAQVKYLSRGRGHTLFLTPGEAVLVLQRDQQTPRDPRTPHPGTVLRLRLIGANPTPRVEGLEPLPGKANYFIGNDPTKWRTNIPTYTKVRYQAVYPGVDLVYYGTHQGQLEYDIVVGPGADPEAIRLAFTGADRLSLDADGNLLLHTAGGKVLQRLPRVYQEINGARQALFGRYVLYGKDQVGFRVAGYDPTKPLVIDPVLAYSTYLGGSGDDMGLAIAVDSLGRVYVTGSTTSLNFPPLTTLQPTYAGGPHDAFVTKFDPALTGASSLKYSTYLGGSGEDRGAGIAVDSSFNAYVTGSTDSHMPTVSDPTATPFPTTAGAFQTTFGKGNSDAFVAVLNPTGSGLVYSTYLGGTGTDEGIAIAVDSINQAYVTGRTTSSDFPTAANTFQASCASGGSAFDAFVAKLSSDGSTRLYATCLGGSTAEQGNSIAVDSSHNAFVTGSTNSTDFPLLNPLQATCAGGSISDAFVAEIDTNGSVLYSTCLGGSDNDQGFGIAVDGSHNAYVTGSTTSSDFPTLNPLSPSGGAKAGGSDAFVAKIAPPTGGGSASLVYSTYLGGSASDFGGGIAVDASGNAYVTGGTTSTDFPTLNPLSPSGGANAGGFDAFVAKIAPPTGGGSASLVYSTYLGGSGSDSGRGIAVDASGNAYVVGPTSSPGGGSVPFPTVGAFQSASGGGVDTFVAKLGGVVSGTFSVTVTLAGTGTVTSSSGGINCPGTCTATFTSGASVTLTATPTGGSTISWGGDCAFAGTGTTCTLTVNANKSVTATFSSGGGGGTGGGGGGAPGCNMVGHVHGNQDYKATVSAKRVNVHVEADGDCDFDKKTGMIFLHHSMVHIVVDGGPPLIDAKQSINGKHTDVKSVTLKMGPPATATVEGTYKGTSFKVKLTDGGKGNKDDTVEVMMPTLPAPTGTPHNDVDIDFD